MISCDELFAMFKKNNLTFFTGVPDSTFKGWMSFLAAEHGKSLKNIVACNECEARWTYAISKLAGEHLSHSYHKEFDLPVVSIRPFNIYGAGQVGEGAIHIFVRRALKNEDIEVHDEGDQIRSWCFIDDIVDAILLCLEKKESIGHVFNIGNPRGTITIFSLAQKVVEICKSKSRIVFLPKPYVDVELRIPSIEKAKKILGFEPKIELDEGIRRTSDWYKQILK